jgi:CDP-glycerol glycerophosphotransferase (TagB/SpsB family)
MSDLENFISSDTRVCLYPANAFKNTQMMRQTQLKHIFINHGESDKIVNQSRFVRAYDKLYLAGPMAKDRLLQSGVNIGVDQVAYVGRPQTSIFIKPAAAKTMNILYAPTWEGFDKQSNYSSVGMALEIVKAIRDETQYKCLFKPHPLTGTVSRELGIELKAIEKYLDQESGAFIRSGNILESMNDCDLLITDISSVMNDFLCTRKPYIVVNPSNMEPELFCERYPTVKGAYILNDADGLSELIREIADSDPKRFDRERVTSYSLGENLLSSLQRFELELEKDCIN